MADDERATGDDLLVTVSRTMAILEMLAGERDGLTLSEMARRLSVNKSIALRILTTLNALNYIFRRAEGDRYLLTYKVSNLGLRASYSDLLLEQVQPIINTLAEASGELVLFSVSRADGPSWVLSSMGAARRRLRIEPSMNMELHSTATGKAWLATQPDDRIRQLVGDTLRATTRHSITTLDALMTQIEKIRQTDVAHADQENEVGIRAVAVPVRSPLVSSGAGQGEIVGFVSITAPVSRAEDEDMQRFIALLKEAATQISGIWLSLRNISHASGLLR